MSCMICSLNSNNENNSFNPPSDKTYFTSLDDFKSYYNLNKLDILKEQINEISYLFPNKNELEEKEKEIHTRIPSINKNRGALHKEIDFISKNYKNIKFPHLEINCYSIKNPTNLKNEIILLRIRNKCFDPIDKKEKKDLGQKSENNSDSISQKSKSSEKSLTSIESESIEKNEKMTLLISHSTSVDLGIIFPRLCDFATTLKCDIISYDYTGYGCSIGKPNYNSLKNDLITVLNFCTNTFDIKYENIVLLSFNIGAIPSIYVASQSNYCSIRGMILVSPMLNFIKKFNDDHINEVICPVFAIQCDCENNVDNKNFIELAKKFKESIYWISKEGKNYEDIIDENRYKFFKKIKKFLSHVHTTRIKISQNLANSVNSSIRLI